MKVKEFIELLKGMDQDTQMFLCVDGHYFDEFEFEEQKLASYLDDRNDEHKMCDAESYVEKIVMPRNTHIKIVEKFPAYVLDMY